jgi:hypothetical protein
MSTCISGSATNECNFCCIKIYSNYPGSSAFAFDLFRLTIPAVNLIDTVLFFLGWEMRSFKYILHNDDNEGHDDDDTDEKEYLLLKLRVSSNIFVFILNLEFTYFLNMFQLFFEKQ